MKKLACEVVLTRTGEKAMRDHTSGEVMHPMGPDREVKDVYLGPSRLEARLREGGRTLVLFDVGLGAGSNAIAALRLAASLPATARRLEIVSFEHDLSAFRMALDAAHQSAFGFDASDGSLEMALALSAKGKATNSRVTWRLRDGDVRAALTEELPASADVIFWDMFSPGTDPDVWSVSTFKALRRASSDSATVHTYSAATAARSGLLLAGFAVGRGDPTGPRVETTVAAATLSDLAAPLDARWLARLTRSSAPFPSDVVDPAAALAEIRQLPQFA